ncbi:MAG TPA: hypothetical protein DEF00_03350 [Candidatus Taylorbacteria bacterium]|nr:MAG: hypothetical protein UY03_C0021G0006 [Parcubacteria group bacterium GW2011_GWA2_47_64]KKU95934.1 MAG: hypothetical protein UY29_C0018G0017 [Parcubacteria group bacterium GW2011_GWC2_48_17]HBV01401.1 hypothetical protein [Candidatus Taylorbacteria bacterium]
MSKTIWIIIVITLLILGGWGIVALTKGSTPQSPDKSVFYEAQSRDHIEVGAEHPEYNSNPPSGGWHYTVTAKKKYYEEPILDGYALHNLEHGDVWITYNPRVPQEVKDELKKFAFSKVLISPREENETDIALVAWERVDGFNLEDGKIPETRIRDFINRYRNQGPEKMPLGAIEATFN